MDADAFETTKSLLRSVLICSKDGVPADKLLEEYRHIVGEDLPYREYGFLSLEALIQSVPDVAKHKWVHGKLFYEVVPDQRTVHIHNLVSKQRAAKKRKRAKNASRRRKAIKTEAKREGNSSSAYDFSTRRYFNENPIVPKTEINENTSIANIDVSRKRVWSSTEEDYVPFSSDFPASHKRIRTGLNTAPRHWGQPHYYIPFRFYRPSYFYTEVYNPWPQSCHEDDVHIYRRLVKDDPATAHKRVCRHFLRGIGCGRGEWCFHLHVPGNMLTQPDRDRFNLPRKQCKQFLATGCTEPDRCRYMHVSNHDLTCHTRQKLKLPSMEPCKFHRVNACWFGTTCEWLHDGESPEIKNELIDFTADDDIHLELLNDVTRNEPHERIS